MQPLPGGFEIDGNVIARSQSRKMLCSSRLPALLKLWLYASGPRTLSQITLKPSQTHLFLPDTKRRRRRRKRGRRRRASKPPLNWPWMIRVTPNAGTSCYCSLVFANSGKPARQRLSLTLQLPVPDQHLWADPHEHRHKHTEEFISWLLFPFPPRLSPSGARVPAGWW